MAAILKVWRQIENPTPSIDAYLFEENSSYEIQPRSDLKGRSLAVFEEVAPTQQEQEQQEEQQHEKSFIFL